MEPPAPVSAAFSVRVVKYIINAFWYGTWISLVIRLAALVTGGTAPAGVPLPGGSR